MQTSLSLFVPHFFLNLMIKFIVMVFEISKTSRKLHRIVFFVEDFCVDFNVIEDLEEFMAELSFLHVRLRFFCLE